jgi:hypothetical protein
MLVCAVPLGQKPTFLDRHVLCGVSMPGVAQAECLRYLALAMRNGAGLQQILPNFRDLHRRELKDHEDMIPDRAFNDGARRFQNIFVFLCGFFSLFNAKSRLAPNRNGRPASVLCAERR